MILPRDSVPSSKHRQDKMAVYAIGDVQGCFAPLQLLLEKINYQASTDSLWFTGDLVNRGPESVEVLRFVKNLGSKAITVLGNHDLNLLAIAHGKKTQSKRDTLHCVLEAPDCDSLLNWLAAQPLLHHDRKLNTTLVHAGLLPGWNLGIAMKLATEVQIILSGQQLPDFLEHMYGDTPDSWQDSLQGWDRLRVITNCFTRLRFCDQDGHMNMDEKGAPDSQPENLKPWFECIPEDHDFGRIIFGHWSTLGSKKLSANKLNNGAICLDDGCLWGGSLTAIRLDETEKPFYSVACSAVQNPWPL